LYSQFANTYQYDSLNRLSSVLESLNGQSADVKQTFIYDRWGNRTIDPNTANTFGTGVNNTQFEVEAATNRLYSPGDSVLGMTQRRIQYDASGNQTYDSYTGSGSRVYDAEDRVTDAMGYGATLQHYAYDGDGHRVRRVANNIDWWQVYGMDGELLAEYMAGAASFIPHEEYGYRNGQLLVTVQNGDEGRLKRFVTHLYERSLGRDPNSTELTNGVNSLATAGNLSATDLNNAAETLCRTIFNSTENANRNRSNQDFVLDLYMACLQRQGDPGGVAYWTSQVPSQGMPAVIEAILLSEEFSIYSQVMDGSPTGDNQRTDLYIYWVYNAVLAREATSTEQATQESAINTASATGQQPVVDAVKTMIAGLFNSTEYANRNRTDTQYVTDLYWAYLQFGQDQNGINYWVSQVPSQGRTAILNNFAGVDTFYEIAGTLYREVQWLVPDQLGTPRMIANGRAVFLESNVMITFHSARSCSLTQEDAQPLRDSMVMMFVRSSHQKNVIVKPDSIILGPGTMPAHKEGLRAQILCYPLALSMTRGLGIALATL
jgi:hypothetical protein